MTAELDVHYLLAHDGTMHSPLLDFAAGSSIDADRLLVVPSVEDLRAGRTFDGTVTISLDLALPTTTTWYARGIGPVRTASEALGFEDAIELTGCTG